MNFRWLMRASLWARNPPSAKRVKFMASIVVLCLILFAVERWIGWPTWLTSEMTPRGRILK